MRVFIDVDVQNDFCDRAGALHVPDSPTALFAAIVRGAVRGSHPILGSVDSHAYDAWEFASNDRRGPNGEDPRFPDHCVKGTWGWLKVDGTLPPRSRFAPNVPGLDASALAGEIVRGETQGLYFEKEVYSLFANPSAEAVLAAVAAASASPLELVVFGVATDYCVQAAVLGLRERGYHTALITDAARGITVPGTEAAMAAMGAAGAHLATAGELGLALPGPG